MTVTALKLAGGRSVKGHKVGLTSKAMRSLTGATEPDYGTLFDNWFILEGDVVPRSKMNRPLVEVELSFVLKEPLRGPNVNVADVIRAVEGPLADLHGLAPKTHRRPMLPPRCATCGSRRGPPCGWCWRR